MATDSALCMSCAVTNVFNNYFAQFAQQAFVVIGNSVVVLAFGFGLAFAIMWYAAQKANPARQGSLLDWGPIFWVLVTSAALKAAAPLAWRTYEALSEWSVAVALQLIRAGSGGTLTVPASAVTPLAQVVGAAENVLWAFIDFSRSAIMAPEIWQSLTEGVTFLIGSILFAALMFFVYGGLLLYFTFIVLRSQLNMLLGVAFAPLIIASAAFKVTRPVSVAGIRLMINGALTNVGAGVAMGFTAVVLRLSRNMVDCYHAARDSDACAGQIGQLASAMGVSSAALTDSFSRAEIFILLIFLGACCWLVHFVVTSYIARLTSSQNDAGALAGFGLATAGIIAKGLRGGLRPNPGNGAPRKSLIDRTS